ncbi:MAG: ABC transporter substrate-binding protein, partial [Lachnospiraceae bacterium]
MRRVKQLLCGLLVGCMIITTGACGKKQSIEEATTEITIETVSDEDAEIGGVVTVWVKSTDLVNTKFAEYKKEFEEKYPGTEVIYQVVPNYETLGYKSIIRGTDADVVMIPENMTRQEVEQYFIPFGTAQELAEKYRDAYIHPYDYDGNIYGIPEYIKPQGIAYNKRVLEYAGIVELPETPDDFVEMLTAIKIDNNEIIPFYIDENSLEDWEQHVWGSVAGDADYHYNGMVMET